MRSRVLSVALTAFAIEGCGFLDTLDDCADLTATVNPQLAKVQLDAGAESTAAEMRNAASIYGAMAENLETKRYRSPRLQTLVAQYAKLARQVADNADGYAAALEKRHIRNKRKAVQNARSHVSRQAALNRRIEAVCSGK